MNGPSKPFSNFQQVSPVQTPVGHLTLDQVERAVPTTLRHSVTQALVDKLNQMSADPLYADNIRNNFISYTAILKDGKFKIEDYVHAVTYVTFKLMGYSNQDSYFRTFPQRHADLVAKGASQKDIAAYVAGYNKGKLVNLILEQSLVPTWVLNQDIYQSAINVQADLMKNSSSELVRQKAADSLLNHLKKPEGTNFQINMDVKEHSGMEEMKNMLSQLAQQQSELIQAGRMKTIDVAASRIINTDNNENE